MATSSTATKTRYHTRSISLPSRAHPQTASLEEQLSRLRSSSPASTFSSSVCHNLGLLSELYESFDDLLQLPHIEQALSQGQRQWAEKALDGSLRLLDVCGMSKDAFVIIKESLPKLESSLRRKKPGESALADEVQSFKASRKNAKRIASKCFKTMSKMKIRGQNLENVVSLAIITEVEAISFPILQSILSLVFGTEGKSLLTKLIQSKQKDKQGEVIEKMDEAFEALKGKKTEKIELNAAESIIQELEEGLEFLFRQLLKSRVSLLNILNH